MNILVILTNSDISLLVRQDTLVSWVSYWSKTLRCHVTNFPPHLPHQKLSCLNMTVHTVLPWIWATGFKECIARAVLNTTLLKQVFQNSEMLFGYCYNQRVWRKINKGKRAYCFMITSLQYWTNVVKTLAYP